MFHPDVLLQDAVDCPEWIVPFHLFKSLAEEVWFWSHQTHFWGHGGFYKSTLSIVFWDLLCDRKFVTLMLSLHRSLQYGFELVFVKNSHEFVHEYMKRPEFIELMRRLGALGDGNRDQSKFIVSQILPAFLFSFWPFPTLINYYLCFSIVLHPATLSPEEWEVAYLYLAFVLKKVGPISSYLRICYVHHAFSSCLSNSFTIRSY